MITLVQPSRSAASVPARICRCIVARSACSETRGSTTIVFAPLSRALDLVVDRRPRVLPRVVAEEHDAVRVADVGKGHPAVGQPVHRRRVARAERHARDPVRRAQQVHEAAVEAVGGTWVFQPEVETAKASGPVRLDHAAEAFGDLVHGLLVGDLLPAILAAFARPASAARAADRHGCGCAERPCPCSRCSWRERASRGLGCGRRARPPRWCGAGSRCRRSSRWSSRSGRWLRMWCVTFIGSPPSRPRVGRRVRRQDVSSCSRTRSSWSSGAPFVARPSERPSIVSRASKKNDCAASSESRPGSCSGCTSFAKRSITGPIAAPSSRSFAAASQASITTLKSVAVDRPPKSPRDQSPATDGRRIAVLEGGIFGELGVAMLERGREELPAGRRSGGRTRRGSTPRAHRRRRR